MTRTESTDKMSSSSPTSPSQGPPGSPTGKVVALCSTAVRIHEARDGGTDGEFDLLVLHVAYEDGSIWRHDSEIGWARLPGILETAPETIRDPSVGRR